MTDTLLSFPLPHFPLSFVLLLLFSYFPLTFISLPSYQNHLKSSFKSPFEKPVRRNSSTYAPPVTAPAAVTVKDTDVTALYFVAHLSAAKLTLVDNILGAHLPLLQVIISPLLYFFCLLFIYCYHLVTY